MKILLIATNQADRFMDRMVVRPLPVGLACLAAGIDETRHDLKVLDLMFSEDPSADVANVVRGFRPEVVGLSIRNLDNQSSLNPVWHLPGVKAVVEEVRANSDAVVVCGGPAFSILPAECLGFVGADLGIAGDGVDSFTMLVDRLEAEEDHRSVPGIVYRHDGGVVVTEGRFTADFRRSPRLDLLDMRRYDGSGFGVGVVTKLARAYYQTADSEPFPGRGWRVRPPDEVAEEIRGLTNDFGISKVFFIDSGFNIPHASAEALCEAVIGSGLNIRWNTYLRPGECGPQLTGLMKRSGCSLALLADPAGESNLADRLDAVGFLADDCRAADLPFALNLSFGEPGETETSVGRKIDFLRDKAPAFASLRVGTRVLPNTSLSETAIDEGLIQTQSDLLKPTFYLASEVQDWLADRLRAESENQPRWHLS